MSNLTVQLDALNIPYRQGADLGKLTWYRMGGSAEVLAKPQSIEQLRDIAQYCKQNDIPMRILGGGANLLVRNEQIGGLVISLDDKAFQKIQIEDSNNKSVSDNNSVGRASRPPLHDEKTDSSSSKGSRRDARPTAAPLTAASTSKTVILRAGAGCDLFKLVQFAARNGLTGLEQIAGIPGTVGGGIKMNAGGAFGDIGANVQEAKVLDDSGKIKTVTKRDLDFSYRHSSIQNQIILEAAFALEKSGAIEIKKRVKEIFSYKKNSQPMGENSAGCAFKNPRSQTSTAAGQLIERAQLKGYKLGTAQVSTIHANFITTDKNIKNPSKANSDDIAKLIKYVQKTVSDKFNINLQREVVIWPDDRNL